MKESIGICMLSMILQINLMAQTESLTDIDGNVYETVKKGAQTWMRENLITTRFNDGSAIQLVKDGALWAILKQPAYCWYDNDTTNKSKYGALYNWYAVETGKLCPMGWHVPSDKVYLADAPYPCASRGGHEYGNYWLDYRDGCRYWTSTECSIDEAYYQFISLDRNDVTRHYTFKNSGLPVRCIKD
jgi:hypothetical protein